MEKGAKGNENCFELAGVSSYRGFELLGVDVQLSELKHFCLLFCFFAVSCLCFSSSLDNDVIENSFF